MQVQITKPVAGWKPGDIVDLPAHDAKWLINLGKATADVIIVEPAPAPEPEPEPVTEPEPEAEPVKPKASRRKTKA